MSQAILPVPIYAFVVCTGKPLQKEAVSSLRVSCISMNIAFRVIHQVVRCWFLSAEDWVLFQVIICRICS
jgi:hypothetical protein